LRKVIKKIAYLNSLLFVGLLLNGLLPAPLWSLDPTIEPAQYEVRTYTTENGLPQSSIMTILQTMDGYIWMGTYEGVVRFDGLKFTLYNTGNTPEMAGNRIKVLLEDRSGVLWIGTSGGLLRYINGSFKNFSQQDGLSINFITALYQDRKGKLWIGTTHGLNCLHKGKIKSYLRTGGTSSNYVSALTEDNNGTLWLGTSGGGISCFKDGKFFPCPISGLPENFDVRVLYRDNNGAVWLAGEGHGAAVIRDGRLHFYSKADGLSGNNIRAIFQDSHDSLWLGTNGQGLNVYRNGVFSYIDNEKSLLSSPIRCIMEDREGSLWVGTRDGLSQLKDGKFLVYNRQTGLPEDSARTIFQDKQSRIWIGTAGGGLVKLENGRFKTFGIKSGFKSRHVWTIAAGSDDSLWVGTYGGGLYRFKNERILENYTTAEGLSSNVVRAVYVDRNDRVWVGTNGGGVDMIQSGQKSVVNYSTKNGLSDNFIYAVTGDRSGNIWVGTYYGSLNRIRDGVVTVFHNDLGMQGYAVWSIYADRDDAGTLWLGTDGSGLVRFRDGRFTTFSSKDGLYSDQAFEVLEDSRGNLWMNCNTGIYSVKKNNIDAFQAKEIHRIPCISFGKKEGIKNTESPGPAQPAGICADDGRIWFPTVRGVVVIDPDHIKINFIEPLVVIEKVTVNGDPLYVYPNKRSSRIRIPPGNKRVEFIFTGLSFLDPSQVRFQYKLDGFDDDWSDADSRRQVSYTNIEPGDYTFRVVACNNDNVWNEKGVVFAFTQSAFFRQTWWFQAAALVLFAFLSYLLIGFIKKHLKLISFWEKKKIMGSYELEEQIGVGGMGIIYKVRSLMDRSRVYAMKVMKEEYMLDELQKKRFKNESVLVDRIDHPNIVKVHERGEHNGKLYIVMELLEGMTLGERYGAKQYPTTVQSIHILIQISHILVNLHREEIIHRDLKPENIMLVTQGGDPDFVKLLDFGIAREQNLPHLTESGEVLGTIAYMPPEVVHNGQFSTAVDIYSMGIIAYEMLTRRKPFVGEKLVDTMLSIMTQNPPEPRELNETIPPRLNQLVMDMIAKEPLKRPDARSLLTILAGLL